jgi:hypothetical protein
MGRGVSDLADVIFVIAAASTDHASHQLIAGGRVRQRPVHQCLRQSMDAISGDYDRPAT